MTISKRYLKEMQKMYGLPDELYTMRRGVKNKGKLRYDVTTIPAFVINGQCNKTKGHIHSSGHSELYMVLKGQGLYMFQNETDFYYVIAKKGECVKVPGDYHHVTINNGKTDLVMANWISNSCKSDYKYLEKMNGMAWYFTPNGFVKNPKYKKWPEIRLESPMQKVPKDLSFLL